MSDTKLHNEAHNQQDATTFSFINIFNSALHVSGRQIRPSSGALFDCICSFWYTATTLLPTGGTVEMELTKYLFCVSYIIGQRTIKLER